MCARARLCAPFAVAPPPRIPSPFQTRPPRVARWAGCAPSCCSPPHPTHQASKAFLVKKGADNKLTATEEKVVKELNRLATDGGEVFADLKNLRLASVREIKVDSADKPAIMLFVPCAFVGAGGGGRGRRGGGGVATQRISGGAPPPPPPC